MSQKPKDFQIFSCQCSPLCDSCEEEAVRVKNLIFFLSLSVFTGDQPGADLGPLISPQAKERVCHLIEKGVKEGASLLLDGRNIKVKGYENGNFVGPTILAKVKVR